MSGFWTRHIHTDGREFYFNSSLNKSLWQLPEGEAIISTPHANAATHLYYQAYSNSSITISEGNGNSAPIVDQSKE
jgi:hypothetical protein